MSAGVIFMLAWFTAVFLVCAADPDVMGPKARRRWVYALVVVASLWAGVILGVWLPREGS